VGGGGGGCLTSSHGKVAFAVHATHTHLGFRAGGSARLGSFNRAPPPKLHSMYQPVHVVRQNRLGQDHKARETLDGAQKRAATPGDGQHPRLHQTSTVRCTKHPLSEKHTRAREVRGGQGPT
jgi:hypothetical protein